MNNELVATVVKYGTDFIETYKRVSRASDIELANKGVNIGGEKKTVIGVAGIQEYVIFQAVSIAKTQTKEFNTSRWGEDLVLMAVVSSDSENNKYTLEFLDSAGNILASRYFDKTKDYSNLRCTPLRSGSRIRVRAVEALSWIQIITRPCKVLETVYTEDTY